MKKDNIKQHLELVCFFKILASTCAQGPYGPQPYASEPYGVPLIILKNIVSQICSRTISENTAPGAYSKHASVAVLTLDIVLEHICLGKCF